jgi:hypothetical protein
MTRGGRGLVSRLTLVAAVVGSVTCLPVTAGAAGLSGAARGSDKVTSGSWTAVAATTSTAPYPTGPLTLTFTPNGANPPPAQFFYVINTGTLSLLGATLTMTVAPAGAVGTVEDCTTTWNVTTGACLGGTISSVLTTATATSITVSVPPAPAGVFYQLRARLSTAITQPVKVTIGVSVTRAQARSAAATNS